MSITDEQISLLRNLLGRLDAERPQVSDAERTALRSLLDAGTTVPDAVDYRIEETVLALTAPEQPEWTLCLDFGTARSKAFACKTDADADLGDIQFEDLEPLDLALGDLDRAGGAAAPPGYDTDSSTYAVVSSIWIDDAGLMYAGYGALQRGRAYEYAGTTRRRLDSIKQQISQISVGHRFESTAHTPDSKPLEPAVNPTSEELTYREAISFYLAYLTDLAVTQLEHKIGTRYVKRRFTLPWWKEERQREWGVELMARALVSAQIVADTFHGRWHTGIHVTEVRAVLALAAEHDERLMWLLDRRESRQPTGFARWGAGLEALAAASGRVWTDNAARELMLVVDVGAGTTDLALFLVVQDGRNRRASPVCGTAVRLAGDSLDSRLLQELLDTANLGEDPRVRERMRDGLIVKGVRQMKERLFQTGSVTETLENDDTVELTLPQFLASATVRSFDNTICSEVQDFLNGVHESWYPVAQHRGLTLILTGGGSNLPMIRGLKDRRWTLGKKPIACHLAKDVPDLVAQRFSAAFRNEYPQLAVAMGGAMPLLLDEQRTLKEWMGGTPLPGPLKQPPGAAWPG